MAPAQRQQGAYARVELRRVHRRLQEIGRAGRQRTQAQRRVRGRGNDDQWHLRGRRGGAQLAGEGDGVQLRHAAVHDHEIGRRGPHPVERLLGHGEGAHAGGGFGAASEPLQGAAIFGVSSDDNDLRHAHSRSKAESGADGITPQR
jgi:hypothetical protein